MNNKIMTEGKMEKAVVLNVENNDVQFIGFVRSNISMTKTMKEVAYKILQTLYYVWTQSYQYIKDIDIGPEFRYESLKKVLALARDYEKSGAINSQKACMSLTAICSFPKKKKAFWINTGSDRVYTYEGGEVLYRQGSQTKKLMTPKEQSIFTMDMDYCFKAEGSVIKTPQSMYIVSSDAAKYFEECMERGIKISQERLEGFSHKKRNPIIIGEISANN